MERGHARRAQVVLPGDEYAMLEGFAVERGTTVSALVREVLEHTILARLRSRRQEAALKRMFGQGLPTADWTEIEKELESMWAGYEQG